MAFCENCGKEVKEDAKFCGGCGAARGIATVPRCPKCGKELKADAVFCEGCGTAVRAAEGVPVARVTVSAPAAMSNRKRNDVELDEPPFEDLSLFGYFLKCLKCYVVVNGRARRKEYWGFTLFYAIGNFALVFIAGLIGNEDTMDTVSGLYFLALLIPSITVSIRRLHDTGRSGWWLLLYFTIIGAIPLIWWICKSDGGLSNKYGKNPKGDDDLISMFSEDVAGGL